MRELSRIGVLLFLVLLVICWSDSSFALIAPLKMKIVPLFIDTITVGKPEIVLTNLSGGYDLIESTLTVMILDPTGDTVAPIFIGSREPRLLDGFDTSSYYFDSTWDTPKNPAVYRRYHYFWDQDGPYYDPLEPGHYTVEVRCRTRYNESTPEYVFKELRVGDSTSVDDSFSVVGNFIFEGYTGTTPTLLLTFRNPVPSLPTVYVDSALTCSLFVPPGSPLPQDTLEIFRGMDSVHSGFKVTGTEFGTPDDSLLDSICFVVNWNKEGTPYDSLPEGGYSVKTTIRWIVLPAFAAKTSKTDTFAAEIAMTPSGGSLDAEVTPFANRYSNAKPNFESSFNLFEVDTTLRLQVDTIGGVPDTSYVVDEIDTLYQQTTTLLDSNMIVVFYPRGDTLFNKGATLEGMLAWLDTLDQGRMKFILDWDTNSTYPALAEDSTYWWEISGGVWDHHSLLVHMDDTSTDTFLVDATPPDMGIWGLNLQDPAFVSTNPSFGLEVADSRSGPGLDSVFADLYRVDYYGEFTPEDTVEDRNYVKRLLPEDFEFLSGNALVHTGVELEDGQGLDVWIFNGRMFDVYQYVGHRTSYPDTLGPMDGVWNAGIPLFKRFYVDGMSPKVRLSSASTHQNTIFEISDTSSGFTGDTSGNTEVLCAGVDIGSLELYENFQLASVDSAEYDTSAGTYAVYFSPSAENVWLVLDIADKVGNKTTYRNYHEDEQLSLNNPHNYPNPFSPVSPKVDQRRTIIDPGLTRTTDVELVIDIYDLAGHHVASVVPERTIGRKMVGYWDGKTDDGTLVANGVYLCHIQVRDLVGNTTFNEVIKIAVAKNDQRIF